MRHPVILVLLLLMLPLYSRAEGIGLSRSRLVYQEGSTGEVVTVKNGSKQLYLLQSGVITTQDGKTSGPFWVTPPIARLEENSQNTIRITGKTTELITLPRDRETIFYFFSTAIPSQPNNINSGEARLSIGLRTLIKLFYRPKGLSGKADDTVSQLRAVSQGHEVVIRNPTPYYASFSSLSLNGKAVDLNAQPSMITPYGARTFHSAEAVRLVSFKLMTDYGGTSDEKTISLNGDR